MFHSQRSLFDIPPNLTYLDTAFASPLPLSVIAVGQEAVLVKAKPWALDRDMFDAIVREARASAAMLIGARVEDIAIVGSTSYGMAIAGRNTTLTPERGVVLAEAEHPSVAYEWVVRCRHANAPLHIVPRPKNYDWTSAFLDTIDLNRERIAAIALSAVHWTDGTIVRLDALGEAARAIGASLILDGTQSVGIVDPDLSGVDPDFLAFAPYKWLLGPYGLGFLYVAPRHQKGEPLENHVWNRVASGDAWLGGAGNPEFLPGAERYDMGQRSNFVTLAMAREAIRVISQWPRQSIEEYTRFLNERIADSLAEFDMIAPQVRFRAPHIVSVPLPKGEDTLASQLRAKGIQVSRRGERLRISPYIFNDTDDVCRLATAIAELKS